MQPNRYLTQRVDRLVTGLIRMPGGVPEMESVLVKIGQAVQAIDDGMAQLRRAENLLTQLRIARREDQQRRVKA